MSTCEPPLTSLADGASRKDEESERAATSMLHAFWPSNAACTCSPGCSLLLAAQLPGQVQKVAGLDVEPGTREEGAGGSVGATTPSVTRGLDGFGAHQDERDEARLVAPVAPCVVGFSLDKTVAGLQERLPLVHE